MNTIAVRTSDFIETIFAAGGSGTWRVNADSAHLVEYVVCCHHKGSRKNDAFMVGKVSEVRHVPTTNGIRFDFLFSEWAPLDGKDYVWPGQRYPVHYMADADALIASARFRAMPERDEPEVDSITPGDIDSVILEAQTLVANRLGIDLQRVDVNLQWSERPRLAEITDKHHDLMNRIKFLEAKA